MVSGIYAIVNPINRKVYVGSSVFIKTRMLRHLCLLNKNEHFNLHLQNAWNHYNIDFDFVVLEIVEDKALLLEKETNWIAITKACDKKFGYNKNIIADSPIGTKDTEETKIKKSSWQKGRKLSEETKTKQSLAAKGKSKSIEHREKLRLANLGKTLSRERVAKQVASRRLNSSWPHPWGRDCRCDECMQAKRKLKKEWRIKTGKT